MKNKLMADFKDAMKNKDEIKKNAITMVRAAIKQVEVDTKKELTDNKILPIITKQVKMRKDALQDFEKAGRTDLVDIYKKEIEVLQQYLPKQLSKEEIATLVETTAKDLDLTSDMKNMGRLMGEVMKKAKGLADGNDVKEVVTEFLKK